MDQGAFGHLSSPYLPVVTLTGEGSSGNLLAAPAVAEGSAPPGPLSMPPGVLDRAELLARVGGDRGPLLGIGPLFVQERPALFESIGTALRDRSAADPEAAAHK